MAQLRLSLMEYMRYIGGTDTSRCVVEGEEVLNAGHIVLYGRTEQGLSNIKLCAVCLQTSALNSEPHQLFGEITVSRNVATISSMECSCKAGAGGRCKHVSAFLILLTRQNLNELEEISSTQLKCAWTSVKENVKEKYKAIPVKEMPCIQAKIVANLSKRPKLQAETVLSYFTERLPCSAIAKHRKGRPSVNVVTFENMEESSVWEKILENASQSPIMLETAALEFNFKFPCCEELFHSILNEERKKTFNIAQNSTEWHSARKFRITGSRCYEIFTYNGKDWEMKSKKFFWPKSFTNKYVRHGLKYEGEARFVFMQKTGLHVEECGMLISSHNKWLGFSPDGIIVENGEPTSLLEIKCLYAGADKTIEEAILLCDWISKEQGVYTLKKRHKYYGQVQLGLSMLNLSCCHFFIYASFDKSYLSIKVEFDLQFSKAMLGKLKQNYISNMIHTICTEKDIL